MRGIKGRREFGDVTMITAFSSNIKNLRVAYANTFQIKVGKSAIDAYRNLFSSTHTNQLHFYKKEFIEALGSPYDAIICDFLYYWLISGSTIPHPIMEVPLSFTWLEDSLTYSRRYSNRLGRRYLPQNVPYAGMDTMLRCLFLTTGININQVLSLSTPSLRNIFESILRIGVRRSLLSGDNNPMNVEPTESDRDEFIPPRYPLSSAIVVATEVEFQE